MFDTAFRAMAVGLSHLLASSNTLFDDQKREIEESIKTLRDGAANWEAISAAHIEQSIQDWIVRAEKNYGESIAALEGEISALKGRLDALDNLGDEVTADLAGTDAAAAAPQAAQDGQVAAAATEQPAAAEPVPGADPGAGTTVFQGTSTDAAGQASGSTFQQPAAAPAQDATAEPATGQIGQVDPAFAAAQEPAAEQPAAVEDPLAAEAFAPTITVTPVVVPAATVAAAGNAVAEDGVTVVTQDGAPTGQAVLESHDLPVVPVDPALSVNAPVVVAPADVLAAGNAVAPETGTVVTGADVGDIPAGMPTGEVVDPNHPETASLPVVQVHDDAEPDATNAAAPAPEAPQAPAEE